ncbi:SMI1/KNR4 family protein [Lysinibacillus mangiferihumi]|uniref:SMI1/KNR4 family protein n=1 Tax=Lysinibacillus mangiferihumi TaxID=1130819 RepID=A0A4U2YHP2_9BACI|nr:SMI1/KNR4 family protein [Lysinibacillus mangiferihumi]
MKYLYELITELQKNKIPMVPCTKDEVDEVKRLIGNNKIPKAYIEFLEVMGGGTEHTFLRGESCYIDELMELNEWGAELLAENNVALKLTPNDFVFWMSQGCMFCFFKLDEGENPPVYFYSEGKKKDGFYKITDTYTDFLQRRYMKDKYIFQKKD